MSRRKRGRPRKKEITIKSQETKTFVGLIFSILGLLSVMSFSLDGLIFEKVKGLVGIGAVPGGITLILLGLYILGYDLFINKPKQIIGFVLLTLIFSTISHFVIPVEDAKFEALQGEGGGMLGYQLNKVMIDTFGRIASVIIFAITGLISISLISDTSINQMKEFFDNLFKKLSETFSRKPKISEDLETSTQFVGSSTKINDSQTDESDKIEKSKLKEEKQTPKESPAYLTNDNGVGNVESTKEEDIIKYPSWKIPSLDLLNPSQPVKQDPEIHKKNAKIIEDTLKSFKIMAKVTERSVGPRVVQYALSITIGTRVSRISSLGNDLALALAAPSGSVRIVAPIPGTSLIGIEMPNANASLVSMSEVTDSKEWQEFEGNLPLIFGKGLTGKIIVRDLTKMPHILVAGATGSGKSVSINAIICGMLMRHSPDYVKFILVDPKMVELPPYNGIPHLLTPVITDVEKVVYSLDWLLVEMKKRFRIFNKSAVRNIQEYNAKMGFPALQYLCLVVDEMADLMLSSGIEVENKIVKLAQMSRATGIHLILATQRPSVDVLTGLIKANIPARVGMNVATSTDSRVILDMNGAENLLGNGDMLFRDPSSSRPFRIQGAFLSNDEISKITSHCRDQGKNHRYNKEVTKPKPGSKIGPGMVMKKPEDPLFREAVKVVVNAGKGSSSLLQRKLRIGYNRAARITDELFAAKIIGPQDGSKPREVLISSAEAFFTRMDGEMTEDQ